MLQKWDIVGVRDVELTPSIEPIIIYGTGHTSHSIQIKQPFQSSITSPNELDRIPNHHAGIAVEIQIKSFVIRIRQAEDENFVGLDGSSHRESSLCDLSAGLWITYDDIIGWVIDVTSLPNISTREMLRLLEAGKVPKEDMSMSEKYMRVFLWHVFAEKRRSVRGSLHAEMSRVDPMRCFAFDDHTTSRVADH